VKELVFKNLNSERERSGEKKMTIEQHLSFLAKKKAQDEEICSGELSRYRSHFREFLKLSRDDLFRQRSLILMKRSPLSTRERTFVLSFGNAVYSIYIKAGQVASDKKRVEKKSDADPKQGKK